MMKETLFNQQSQTTKLLQLFMLFVMLFAPKGMWAQVVFDGGNGTADSPYVISTSDQLKTFAQAVNAGTQATENLYFRIADLMETPTIDCSNLNDIVLYEPTTIILNSNMFSGLSSGKRVMMNFFNKFNSRVVVWVRK